MSRRESVVKATAAALHAKTQDLTQYRQRSSRDSTFRLKPEHAAGALAFSARNDALGAALLRYKYAQQSTRDVFVQALMLLLARHGWNNRRRPSVTMYACGFVALFEWGHDQCPKCRAREVTGRGMRCVTCSNSGRKAFRFKQRHRLVNEFLRDAGASTLAIDTFDRRWDPVYLGFLHDLRAVDRTIASPIDLGLRPSENRLTVPEPREPVAEPAEDEPEKATNSPGTGPAVAKGRTAP